MQPAATRTPLDPVNPFEGAPPLGVIETNGPDQLVDVIFDRADPDRIPLHNERTAWPSNKHPLIKEHDTLGCQAWHQSLRNTFT
jgi:hypothetical protein